MKNLMNHIISITLVLLMVSCNGSFLDKDPISSFSAQKFYEKPSDAQAGVYGIYNGLQSTFRVDFAYWGEGRADAVQTRHSGDPYALKENQLTPVIRSTRWNNLYRVISRANYVIKYIPGIFEAEESQFGDRLMGQARAARAIAYFYLVRIWGDVPLILEPYENIDQELFVTRTNKEVVLDQIEEDLTYASLHCAESYGGEKNRVLITQGAADAFLTKVYMWRHKYEEAIESAERVLENPLYSLVSIQNWNDIFSLGLSSESIFEVGYDEVQTNAMRVLYALGSDADYFPSEKFRNSFEPEDLRKNLIYDTTAVEPRKVWKFFGEGFNDESAAPSSNNIVLIRLADIMLLKAEAHAQRHETEPALDLLNRIRNRAGLNSLDLMQAEDLYGDLGTAILHERLIELSFEGHRWFDLIRTGKVFEIMEPINGLKDEANLLWPIHEDAINKNPNLKQNEFYK